MAGAGFALGGDGEALGALALLGLGLPNCSFDVDDWSGDYQEFLPYEALIGGTRSATYTAANWIFQQGGTIPALGDSSGYAGMPCSDGAGSQHMYQYPGFRSS